MHAHTVGVVLSNSKAEEQDDFFLVCLQLTGSYLIYSKFASIYLTRVDIIREFSARNAEKYLKIVYTATFPP